MAVGDEQTAVDFDRRGFQFSQRIEYSGVEHPSDLQVLDVAGIDLVQALESGVGQVVAVIRPVVITMFMLRGSARRTKIEGHAKTQRGSGQKQSPLTRCTQLSHQGSYLPISKSERSAGGAGHMFIEGPRFLHKAPLMFSSSIF